MKAHMFQWIAKKWLAAIGWRTTYVPQPSPHGIYIVYPHTSNWDFFIGILWKISENVPTRWVAKDSWFHPPIGWLMRGLGGIGIKRNHNLDSTTKLKNTILAEDHCWLSIAIEGTRNRKDHIHMGYYHIARSANIPIGIAFIDYAAKHVGVREYRYVKESIEEELAQLKNDYINIEARYPEQMSDLKTRQN